MTVQQLAGRALLAGCLCLLANACSNPDNQSAEQKTPAPAAAQSQTPPPDPSAGTTSGGSGGQCADLLQGKCTQCHSTARICEKLGKKSKSRWERTLERMVTRGAKINASEAAALITCLEQNSSEARAACQ